MVMETHDNFEIAQGSLDFLWEVDPKSFSIVFKTFFDQSSDPICLLDDHRKIIRANKPARNIIEKWSLSDQWFIETDSEEIFDAPCNGLFIPFPFYHYFLLPMKSESTRFCLFLKKNKLYLPEQKDWFLTRKGNELLRFFSDECLTDPLTGLPTRSIQLPDLFDFFSCSGTLIFCDINKLKQINDTWGHSRGDQILKFVADTLSKYFSAPSIPIRYGGDEFLIYSPDLDLKQGQAIFDISITKTLKEVACSLNLDIPIRLDYGFASFHAGDRFESVLQKADIDFYHRKNGLLKNQ